ncbi:MAG: SIS domain-containing protein [Sphingomonadales bacterium]|nr:SIS domain-containing protein [Sphingomonadales bacterium]
MNAPGRIPAPGDVVALRPEPVDWALDVLRAEAAVLEAFLADPPPALAAAIAMVAQTALPVLCCGVGKSGLVAAKVAATLSSLGTPAFPLSAGDAAHGDLGAVLPGSVVLLFSNSGATDEIVRILPSLRARACRLVGLVGRAASPVGRGVQHVIPLPVVREADHLGLAPTASTTLQIAVGDAIAVAASRLRGFTTEDFLRHHPAGQLGRNGLPVATIMRTGAALPTVARDAPLADTIHVMSAGLMGAACVTAPDRTLLGLVVDGDIRRAIEARTDLYAVTAAEVMRPDPVVLGPRATIGDAIATMRRGFLVLPVADDAGRLLGMVHSVDLVQLP